MLRKVLTTTIVLTLVAFGSVAEARQGNSGPAHCTVESGQQLIGEGRYEQAIREFTCVIDDAPTEVEGYRGRIEAELLLGLYSNAFQDYGRITAFVLPVHPDARNTIVGSYAARLANAPEDIPALMGASFAHWYFFEYAAAIQVLNDLLDVQPDSVYGNLFRGSSRVLGGTKVKGVVDLEVALALAPFSPDVRSIVADAYTYGLFDSARAFLEASLALEWGLDTPRVHAILGAAYNAFGDELAAATHIQRHFELVTTELVTSPTLVAGTSLVLDFVPGRTYDIPVPVTKGEKISIVTSSHDYFDTIALLLAPDGSLVLGSDDDKGYFAAFERIAEVTGIYHIRVTFFESVITGKILVNFK